MIGDFMINHSATLNVAPDWLILSSQHQSDPETDEMSWQIKG